MTTEETKAKAREELEAETAAHIPEVVWAWFCEIEDADYRVKLYATTVNDFPAVIEEHASRMLGEPVSLEDGRFRAGAVATAARELAGYVKALYLMEKAPAIVEAVAVRAVADDDGSKAYMDALNALNAGIPEVPCGGRVAMAAEYEPRPPCPQPDWGKLAFATGAAVGALGVVEGMEQIGGFTSGLGCQAVRGLSSLTGGNLPGALAALLGQLGMSTPGPSSAYPPAEEDEDAESSGEHGASGGRAGAGGGGGGSGEGGGVGPGVGPSGA